VLCIRTVDRRRLLSKLGADPKRRRKTGARGRGGGMGELPEERRRAVP